MPEVAGSIPFLGILEFLQVAGFNHRDLVMMLDNAAGEGYLVMNDGCIVDASLSGKRGENALFPLLMGCTEGTFQILPPPKTMPEPTINSKMDQILMRIAMSLPPPDTVQQFNPDWHVTGTTELLSVAELLQVLENNHKSADIVFEEDHSSIVSLSNGGILSATRKEETGPDAVYSLFLSEGHLEFDLISKPIEAGAARVIDIASVICEGLRLRDESELHRTEFSAEDNPHAKEMLDRLEAGELGIQDRMEIAHRYMPGGQTAPAWLIAKLTVDECEEVRATALNTLNTLPDPVIEAFAGDAETPRALLRYLLCEFGSTPVAMEAVRNPSTPIDAIVQYAATASAKLMPVFKEIEQSLMESQDLREALRRNQHCTFTDVLDKMDKLAGPRMRKRKFTGVFKKGDTGDTLILQKPENDDNVEVVKSKLAPKDLQFMARRGTLRQKLSLVCGNDAEIAHDIISQPGLPDTFYVSVAENTSANPAALTYIGSNRTLTRNPIIARALCFNPKTPVPTSGQLLGVLRAEEVGKLAQSRDHPDGLKQMARHLIAKRQKG